MASEERNDKAETRREIDELLARCLSCVEQGDDDALEQVLTAHPEHATVLRRRLELLRVAGFARAPGPREEFPERLGDFRLLTRLGGGGMGVVYLAEQLALGRRVAVKLIRPEQLYFPGARARFEREAQAVARLAHPGIVQVHTVGDERGLPYIAMELVDGATLSDVLTRLRAQPSPDARGEHLLDAVCACLGRQVQAAERAAPPFDLSWNDACVWIGRELAQALEHAHQRGVVHRDIKPSNVMLTPGGRVLLVDFGLAMASGVDTLTRPGSALGSLPYMAPEQVDGRVAEIGPRTDIYGLAATLYELISLRRPFEAADSTRLRAQILGSDAPRLRRRAPTVSADLEAVLAVAMAAEPARRYGSAADFARELSHVLAREPVEARHAGVLERARRWAKRNPAQALAAAFAAVIVVGGPTGFGVFQSRAAAKERELSNEVSDANALLAARGEELAAALSNESNERRRAEQNFAHAMDAVDTLLARVGAVSLEDVPQMEPVRRELLEDALEFYGRFDEQASRDSSVRLRAAITRRRVAMIREELGDLVGARASARAAVEELRALEELDDAPPGLAQPLCSALAQLGGVLLAMGDFAQAEAALRELLTRLERVADEPQHAAFVRRQAATTRQHLAYVLRDSGREAEAVEEARRALELFCSDSEATIDADDLYASGVACLSLAVMRLGRAPAEQSQRELASAVELLRTASERAPSDPRRRESLASALGNLGVFLSRQTLDERRRFAGFDARTALAESVQIYLELIADFPLRALYRAGLQSSSNNLCVHLARQGRLSDARPYANHALAAARMLVELAPQSADHHSQLGSALSNLARMDWLEGKAEQALEGLERARGEIEFALAGEPQNAAFAEQLRQWRSTHVEVLHTLGRWAQKLEALREFERRDADRNVRLWIVEHKAQCVELLAVDSELDEGERERLSAELMDETVAGLRELVGAGVKLASIANSEKFAPLRGWPSFEALIGAVEER